MSGADSRRLRAGRLESLAALAGGVTHELNNLTASVTMSVQLLEPACADEAGRQVLASLHDLASRIQHAGRQLHWLARGVAGEPTAFQAQYLLGDLQKLARVAFPSCITVITRYPADLWPLAGDPLLVYQLLLALCLEARDHLPTGGTLVLAASNARIGAAGQIAAATAGGAGSAGEIAAGDAGGAGDTTAAGPPPGRYVLLEAIGEPQAAAGAAEFAAGAAELAGVATELAPGAAIHSRTAAATGERTALARRRRKAAEAARCAAAAGGFTAPLPPAVTGRGRRAYLPAVPEDPAIVAAAAAG